MNAGACGELAGTGNGWLKESWLAPKTRPLMLEARCHVPEPVSRCTRQKGVILPAAASAARSGPLRGPMTSPRSFLTKNLIVPRNPPRATGSQRVSTVRPARKA